MLKKQSFSYLRMFILLAIFFVLYTLTIQLCVVNGDSMNNTLKNNQILFQLKLKPATYGDIVSIYSDSLDEMLCKRVIALEGDEVTIRGKEVYVNGNLLDEPYAYYDYEPNQEYNFLVSRDCVFVLGDNRNHSTDSRQLGCLHKSNIASVYVFNLSDIVSVDYDTIRTILEVCWFVLFVVWVLSGIKFKNKSKMEKSNEQIEIDGKSN